VLPSRLRRAIAMKTLLGRFRVGGRGHFLLVPWYTGCAALSSCLTVRDCAFWRAKALALGLTPLTAALLDVLTGIGRVGRATSSSPGFQPCCALIFTPSPPGGGSRR
jgi:hypothetical protein